MAERKLLRERRIRGTGLKLVRDNHQAQISRMDDLDVWTMLQKIFTGVGREYVWTLLQDMSVLGYLEFESHTDEMSGLLRFERIQLTASGLRLVSAGRSNEDIELR
jgi:hypothetical protein